MGSVWNETETMRSFGPLEQDCSVDVLVIGGGMAGLLTAYFLKEQGIDVALCEAETIGGGTTQNTTAKITSQHGLCYAKLIERFGERFAGFYLMANEEALKRYRSLCERIDCDLETQPNYIYSLYSEEAIQKELRALRRIGAPAERVDTLPLPFDVAGAIRFSNQAQFHQMRFLNAISEGLPIYTHTRVRELIRTQLGIAAVTNGGTVTAKRIVVATHFPFLNKHGFYFMKLYQHRSYVIALENAEQLNGMYLDENPLGLSFRNYGNLLFIGGGSHRTGKPGEGVGQLRAYAERYYPNAPIRYEWAAQDCMSLDGVPYIGPYSSGTENLYVATGFNKWGMTGSMVAATLLTDLILGRENPYAELFSPSRSMLRPALFQNAAEAVRGWLTPKAPRCPHLGCALEWNEAERTWDCPCHGSRFSEDGSLIDNPATGDLKMNADRMNRS